MSDALEKRVDALSRRLDWQQEQIDERETRIKELEDRVAELEQLVDPDPGATTYDQLTKEQKVAKLRKTLLRNAMNQGGASTMKYKAVMSLFNGHPSPGHCYDLMERAGEMDGYTYETGGHGKGQKRIRVDADAVKDDGLIHAVKKEVQRTPTQA